MTLKNKILARASVASLALSLDYQAQVNAFAIIEIDDGEADGDDPTETGAYVQDGIAVIKVRGLLLGGISDDLTRWGVTGYPALAAFIDAAAADEGVNEIWLDVDSKGGEADGLNLVIDALEGAGKPVRTFVTGSMSSAAYWIGCVGSPIVATDDLCSAGSIGCYALHVEESEALAKQGITARIFRSHFWKGALESSQPLRDKDAEKLQSIVDGVAAKFTDHVVKYRGLTADDVKAFDGDTFPANEAVSKNLIDAIGDGPEMTLRALLNSSTSAPAPVATAPAPAPVVTASAPAPVSTDPAPATFTQEQLDAAVADALAKSTQANERRAAIMAHANGSADLKAQMCGDAFAAVPLADVLATLDKSGPTVAQALDAVGGAGVTANPTTPESPAAAEAKAKAESQEKSIASIKASGVSVL